LTQERTLRVTGESGRLYFLNMKPEITYDPTGIPVSIKSPFADSEFDFVVKAGSAAPPDPEKLFQMLDVMNQRGLISGEQFVSYTPFDPDGPALRPQQPQPDLAGSLLSPPGGGSSLPLPTAGGSHPIPLPTDPGISLPAPGEGVMQNSPQPMPGTATLGGGLQ
jgi:hypothetical protein